MSWETVIGFEIHTELLTASKVWCGCSTEFGRQPNTQVCPVCLGLPGSLPVLNERALELSMRASLALGCTLTRRSQFERKNYYYPDLPKNYQISQLRKNLATGGGLAIRLKDGTEKFVRMNNIHLEEDAGKLIHPETPGADYSLVDLNRAGTSLLEIVTEPDLRSAEESLAFMEALKAILEYTAVSDCNMHEGRLRFEANISVRRKGDEKLGTKVEVKNLNSMETVLKCIEHETERQIELIEAGGRVIQETRLWDEAAAQTRAMRSKEVANDYRYFPDPDLIEVELDDEWIARVRNEMPNLPEKWHELFRDRGVNDYLRNVIIGKSPFWTYRSENVMNYDLSNKPNDVCNVVSSYEMGLVGEYGSHDLQDHLISEKDLAILVKMIHDGTINKNTAEKIVYPAILAGEGAPAEIVRAKGLEQVSDASAIEPIVDEVLARNPKSVEDFKAGKERALGALVGQVMKASQGKANPGMVNELIKKKIAAL